MSRNGFRSLPLERKLPLLILGLLAGILALWMVLAYYEMEHASELAAVERISTLARTMMTSLENGYTTRLGGMRRASRDTAIVAAVKHPASEPSAAAQAVLTSLTSRADSSTPPQLWSRDGRKVGQIGLAAPEQEQHRQLDAARAAATSDSGYVGPLHRSGARVGYWVAVPIREHGELLGFIAQERRVAATPSTLKMLRDVLGEGISLFLHNTDNSLWTDLAGNTLPAPVVEDSLNGLVVQTRPESGRWLAAIHSVTGAQLALSVEMPYSGILARPRRIIRILALVALLLVGGGGVAAWLISRRLVRPLVDVTAAAESFAQGNYERRVAAAGRDEVGRLATAFNQMASRVQESHDATQHALRMEGFLGEAGQLLAGSLSDETLIADLARYCVPTMADYCTIHVAEDDGSIRRVATAHFDRSLEASVRELVSFYSYRTDGPGEVAETIRTQRPVIRPHIDIEPLKKAATKPRVAELLDEIRPSSFLCVPLIARGRAFGAMSFTMTTSGRVFSEDNLSLITELARRTAVAIDNAAIYRRSLDLRLEAEAASQAKSDFMAKMSHEIRTPINAMMGYAELIELEISGPITDAQRTQLVRIRSSGEHLTALVGEILDLAKIEAGRMAVRPLVGVAGEVADAALALIRPQAASKGVQLTPRVEGNPQSEYIGDPQRVQQILTNLLSNAVKFTEAGGTVSLSCGNGVQRGEGGRSWTWLTVEDTGVGIAAEDHERIFHAFVQVDGGYTRAHGGTGLGLTISRNLAQMMNGDLTVESAAGNGSRFTLWLPAPTSCTE